MYLSIGLALVAFIIIKMQHSNIKSLDYRLASSLEHIVQLKRMKLEKENLLNESNAKLNDALSEINYWEKLEENRSDLLSNTIASHKTAFPYIAGLMADYLTADLEIMAQSLDWGSNVVRAKKVKSLRDIRSDCKVQLEASKVAIYELEYLMQLYPALEDILNCDFRDLDLNKHEEIPDYDPIRYYLTKLEWEELSPTERNQLALDNYVKSHSKTNWQIGRDYELYVGYKYSINGYDVDYCGSYMGLEDMGRDLICTKDNVTRIIQCKYWSKTKTIHEKHIFQLYGTTVTYALENKSYIADLHPLFITNIQLSDMAKQVAHILGVEYVENYAMGEFPRIKCNIGKTEYGSAVKIYHLPMDQQYDNTKIIKKGEQWAFTVAEAEAKGFRRAFRWHGE